MNSDFTLVDFFINDFHIQDIFNLGWYASQEWMFVISGILTVVAVSIRAAEEGKAQVLGQSKLGEAVVAIVAISFAIGLYGLLVHLLLSFMQDLRDVVSQNGALNRMGLQMDKLLEFVGNIDSEFSFSEVASFTYSIFATIGYFLSYGILIMLIVAMKLAHAVLTSFAIFWGAVALPMSITTGFKQLKPLGIIAGICIIWPIVESFFIYLVAGSFEMAMTRAGIGLSSSGTVDFELLLTVLAIFTIVNLLMAAAIVSAPMIAQGMANGTGNVTGMIASFATAGVAAGVVAGANSARGINAAGSAAGKAGKAGATNLANNANSLAGRLNENKPFAGVSTAFSNSDKGINTSSLMPQAAGASIGVGKASEASLSKPQSGSSPKPTDGVLRNSVNMGDQKASTPTESKGYGSLGKNSASGSSSDSPTKTGGDIKNKVSMGGSSSLGNQKPIHSNGSNQSGALDSSGSQTNSPTNASIINSDSPPNRINENISESNNQTKNVLSGDSSDENKTLETPQGQASKEAINKSTSDNDKKPTSLINNPSVGELETPAGITQEQQINTQDENRGEDKTEQKKKQETRGAMINKAKRK